MTRRRLKRMKLVEKIERHCEQKGLSSGRLSENELWTFAPIVRPTGIEVLTHRFTQRSPTLLELESSLRVPSERLDEVRALLLQENPLEAGALLLTAMCFPASVLVMRTTAKKLTAGVIDHLFHDAEAQLRGLLWLIDKRGASAKNSS